MCQIIVVKARRVGKKAVASQCHGLKFSAHAMSTTKYAEPTAIQELHVTPGIHRLQCCYVSTYAFSCRKL